MTTGETLSEIRFFLRFRLSTRNVLLFPGFSSSSNTKGTPLGTVRCCEGRTTLVAWKQNLDRVCKRESKLPGPKNPKGKF